MKTTSRDRKAPSRTKAVPPDPEMQNANRVRLADSVLETFQWKTGADIDDALRNMLTNLMLWCERFGHDFQEELRRIQKYYRDKTAINQAMAGVPRDDF